MFFWKKDRKADPTSLADEIVKIGSKPKIKGGEGSELYFWRPKGEGVGQNEAWGARTRQIGGEALPSRQRILDLMFQAHEHVASVLGQ